MGGAPPSTAAPRPRAALDAIAGGDAGAAARLVVGPLDVLKIRFQVQLEPVARGGATAGKYTGLGQALRTIVAEEGLAVREGREGKGGRTRSRSRAAPR